MSIAEKYTTLTEKIPSVYEAGYAKGQSGGGYGEGFEAGKQAERDAFWESYQDNGNRTAYNYAFAGVGWTDITFKPKYDIVPSGAVSNFFAGSYITNLKKLLQDQGVVMNWKDITSITHPFGASSITDVGELDLRGLNTLQYFMFQNCNVKNIDLVLLRDDGSQEIPSNTFQGARQLEEIRFAGKFGVSINFQWSTNLSHDSLVSIINALADKSTDTSGTLWEVTLGSVNIAKLTDAEQQIARKKGWTIS